MLWISRETGNNLTEKYKLYSNNNSFNAAFVKLDTLVVVNRQAEKSVGFFRNELVFGNVVWYYVLEITVNKMYDHLIAGHSFI